MPAKYSKVYILWTRKWDRIYFRNHFQIWYSKQNLPGWLIYLIFGNWPWCYPSRIFDRVYSNWKWKWKCAEIFKYKFWLDWKSNEEIFKLLSGLFVHIKWGPRQKGKKYINSVEKKRRVPNENQLSLKLESHSDGGAEGNDSWPESKWNWKSKLRAIVPGKILKKML